ncbi:MAG: class I SAM-dependent methyltransferase [Roseiflexaceae bacterium]
MSTYDPIAHFYDVDHADFQDDVEVYLELARRAGGSVYEAMCGSGRLIIPLAKQGIRITGTDIAAGMLAIAQQRIAAEGLAGRAQVALGDVREPAPGGPYSLAIVGVNSFMHLTTTADQLAALAAIRASLRPSGLLAIDLLNPNPRLLADYDNELIFDKAFQMPDGTRVQKFVAQQIDAASQINHVTFIYDVIGLDGSLRRYTAPFRMRWVYRYELEHLLLRSGFVLEQVYGSYELDRYRSDSETLLVVARAS